LSDAFNRFFKGLAKYPNFKKKGLHDSFTLDATPRRIKLGVLALFHHKAKLTAD
jgi:putative transposase